MKPLKITILENALKNLEKYVPSSEHKKESVSKASIAWHLDHSLKVINAVIKSMEQSDPALYKKNLSFLGKLLLILGAFPRGKAKAPKHVLPPKTIVKEDIITQLAEAKENIKMIPNFHRNAYFKHPIFGNINSFRVVRFLEVHTNHHLKIVRIMLK